MQIKGELNLGISEDKIKELKNRLVGRLRSTASKTLEELANAILKTKILDDVQEANMLAEILGDNELVYDNKRRYLKFESTVLFQEKIYKIEAGKISDREYSY